jgi:hypothetical protein
MLGRSEATVKIIFPPTANMARTRASVPSGMSSWMGETVANEPWWPSGKGVLPQPRLGGGSWCNREGAMSDVGGKRVLAEACCGVTPRTRSFPSDGRRNDKGSGADKQAETYKQSTQPTFEGPMKPSKPVRNSASRVAKRLHNICATQGTSKM